MKFTAVELPYNFQNLTNHELTNDIFILNESFFVKRSKEVSKAFLDWNNQLNVIELVRNQPFTLPILEAQFADEKLWVLMPYYPKLTTLADQPLTHEILQQLVPLVQQLHAIAPNEKIKKWDAVAQLNLYCNLVKSDDPQLATIKNELTTWLQTYQPQKMVLCHNDLVTNNFVQNEQQWYLIDWDFAMINDPLFDVASFASETLTTSEDINYWCELFQITTEERKIVTQWMKYQNLIWHHWALFLHQKTKNKTYQNIAEEKLKKLLN